MLSRSILRASLPSPGVRNAHLRSRGPAPRRFSQQTPHRVQRAPFFSRSQQSSKEHHGEGHQPLRSSIRPFTVLFFCIPLGYCINWALKNYETSGHTSPDGFVKYILASKEDVSSTCSIFSLIPSTPFAVIDADEPELARSIKSVQFKQPQLQIARHYTLLPRTEGQDEDEIRFLIKREQKGEVSGYLHRLPLDAEVEVRGISKEYTLPQDLEKVVFLAGGTGIAPAMQIADMLKSEKADVHILWANRKREDCASGTSDTMGTAAGGSWWDWLRVWRSNTSDDRTIDSGSMPDQRKHQIVRELDAAKDTLGQRLRVDYFVDEEGTFLHKKDVNHLMQDHAPGKKLLIVSGPEGFINQWAGPKQWLNGREVQGPLAGVLGGMNTAGWEVVKL